MAGPVIRTSSTIVAKAARFSRKARQPSRGQTYLSAIPSLRVRSENELFSVRNGRASVAGMPGRVRARGETSGTGQDRHSPDPGPASILPIEKVQASFHLIGKLCPAMAWRVRV